MFRDGIEYEFTMYFEMTADHLAVVSKDRTGLFGNEPPFMPTRETGQLIRQWLDSGVERPQQNPHELAFSMLAEEINQLTETAKQKSDLFKWYEERKREIEVLPNEYREKIYTLLKEAKETFIKKTQQTSKPQQTQKPYYQQQYQKTKPAQTVDTNKDLETALEDAF